MLLFAFHESIDSAPACHVISIARGAELFELLAMAIFGIINVFPFHSFLVSTAMFSDH